MSSTTTGGQVPAVPGTAPPADDDVGQRGQAVMPGALQLLEGAIVTDNDMGPLGSDAGQVRHRRR